MHLLTTLMLLTACTDVENPDGRDGEQELVSTVVLTLTPDGGDASTFTWADPELDGDPEFDPMTLTADTTYALSVAFLNGLEDPPEDLSAEISDEADEHQVFYTGSAIDDGLLVHSYDDTDAAGLPLGLEGTLETGAAGSGELVVTLQHLPAQGEVAVKVEGLAEDVETDGLGALPGDSDASVTFDVTVE